ncbi:isochorismatase family protein [Streptomyces sp. NPDC102467]|uniref:isochorismatase family protein n=1 Tax=Streptomyces sp. NPDC102467 TaxID=3366179 RepID=UPI003806F1F2
MALPTITPYPMPGEGDLPHNTAQWTVDPHRAVLLIHDMQEYFLAPFPQDESPLVPLVANTAALRERCAQLGIPVVYTAQPGDMSQTDRGLLKDFWGPGMSVSPEHKKVCAEVAPAEGDTVLTKWRYSAFFRTELLEQMRESGRDQLIVCGVYAHVGVLMTTADAFTNDIQPFLVGDAIADFSLEYHRLALTYAAERTAMTVTTKSVLETLTPAREGAR